MNYKVWILLFISIIIPLCSTLNIYSGMELDNAPFVINSELDDDNWAYFADERIAITDFFVEQLLHENFDPVLTIMDEAIVDAILEFDPPDFEDEEIYTEDFSEALPSESSVLLTLVVYYKCLTPGATDIVISGSGFKGNETVEFSFNWKKICGSGPRLGFHIGTKPDQGDVVEDGVTLDEWSEEGFAEILADEIHTIFYLWIEPEFGSQEIENPILRVQDQGILGASARDDAAFATVLQEDNPLTLSMVYECKGRGSTKVSVSYKIGSFDPVVFSFIKDCGGGVSHGVHVGLSEYGTEIIENGSPASNFLLTSATPYSVSKNDEKLEFYVRMADEGDSSIYNTLILSANPGQLMDPYIVPFTAAGQNEITSEPKKLTIYFDCKKKGEGQVIATFIMPTSAHMEFSFKKECLKPRPRIDNSVWTANQLLVLTCFTFAAFAAAGYYYYTKNSVSRRAARSGDL